MATRNSILDAVGFFFVFVFFFILFKVSIYELQHIIVVNLLQNAQVLFHVANAMDAISLKDIKGNACEL